MNVYENIVIFNPSLPDEEIETATTRIKDLIASEKGEVLKVDPWGRRKLAYEINKQTRGFYTLLLFRAPSPVVRKLEELYKVYDPVFKYMIVKLEKKQMEAALKALAEAEAKAAEAEAKAAESPAEEAPAAESPAEEAPAAESPAAEAPAAEAPAAESPAEEAPAEAAPEEPGEPEEKEEKGESV
jgi:small subunit ribosomal protein S6